MDSYFTTFRLDQALAQACVWPRSPSPVLERVPRGLTRRAQKAAADARTLPVLVRVPAAGARRWSRAPGLRAGFPAQRQGGESGRWARRAAGEGQPSFGAGPGLRAGGAGTRPAPRPLRPPLPGAARGRRRASPERLLLASGGAGPHPPARTPRPSAPGSRCARRFPSLSGVHAAASVVSVTLRLRVGSFRAGGSPRCQG